MPKRLELVIEAVILASRWLLVVFYLGLALALAIYAMTFAVKLWDFVSHVLVLDESEAILKMLGLIDAALVASLVVMVIIGLLAAYVGPRYFSQIGKSEIKVAKAQMDAFDKALEQYRLDVGRFPNTEQGLAALYVKPNNETKWAGPYLKKAPPPDPWGAPYQYKSPGEVNEFDLISFGKDGRRGGDGEDADISFN